MKENVTGVYPEHEKLKEVRELSQILGWFLEWLETQEYAICHNAGRRIPDWEPVERGRSIRNWLALFFDIDLEKLESEKDAMIAELSKAAARQGAEDAG